MGFSCYAIGVTNHSPLKSLQDFTFTNLLGLITSHKTNTTNSSDEFHPSPSLVPLPNHLISKSKKDHQLPIVQYAMIKPPPRANNEAEDGDDHSCCAVCLSCVEPWHNVRELGNCDHVFHVECLDSWMDHSRDTCPVCRAKLLPGHGGEFGLGKDPWRSERMVYLFGEDCLMEELE